MKILIAGFEGEDNSAKILLDNIKEECPYCKAIPEEILEDCFVQG